LVIVPLKPVSGEGHAARAVEVASQPRHPAEHLQRTHVEVWPLS
jgi:hypothetical protein